MIWKSSPAVALIVILSHVDDAAHAQSSGCASQLRETSSATVVISCFQQSIAEIESLRREVSSLRTDLFRATEQTIPPNAVLAFDDPRGCPPGWYQFNPAEGRFLIAASPPNFSGSKPTSGTRYSFRSIGGAEVVELKPTQIPSHRHAIPLASADGVKIKDAGSGLNIPYFDYRKRDDVEAKIDYSSEDEGVLASGSSEGHENMPPYIALYFCKKD